MRGKIDISTFISDLVLCGKYQNTYPLSIKSDNDHLLAVPLPAGTDGKLYRERVKAAWFEKLAQFKPQFIFFSAGFDAHRKDFLADLNLSVEDYVWLTHEIAKIAKKYAEGRMVSVLEGGYNLDVLHECVPAHIHAMVE